MKHQSTWTSALVIEDDSRLSERLLDFLGERGLRAHACCSVESAVTALSSFQPDLVLLDFKLPDGDGFGILRHLQQLEVWPYVIALSGEARPADSFELARLGVRRFLTKPLCPEELQRVFESPTSADGDLVPALRSLVGAESIVRVETLVRETMVREALARTKGSRSGAARLLQVSRQMLQHVLRQLSPSTDPP